MSWFSETHFFAACPTFFVPLSRRYNAAGFVWVLGKPFDNTKLVAALEESASARQARPVPGAALHAHGGGDTAAVAPSSGRVQPAEVAGPAPVVV